MAVPLKKPFITPEEYLRIERVPLDKSEYIAGEMFAMAGGSPRQSLICANTIGELRNLLKGSGCATYDSNLRIKIPETELYTYPDVSVVCGPLEFPEEGDDMIVNPTLLVEVLSDSSEAYDRGTKFAHYRRLASFREYMLISQTEHLVEGFSRQEDGVWVFRSARGIDAAMPLASLGVDLRLSEVYAGVDLPPSPPLRTVNIESRGG